MIRTLLFTLLAACPPAFAEQKQALGEYVAHYNAQNTSELSPEVARRYGIAREPRLAMVMVTVQKKTGEAVAAAVTGQARNLLGQVQPLQMREVREGESIYYLGLFSISNLDTQTFDLDVRPEKGQASFRLRFNQQFFVTEPW